MVSWFLTKSVETLGKGTFKVIQTKFDTGDFTEKFLIILVQNEK